MLTAFSASFLLILLSELGDKTFFVAAVLAMSSSRLTVFIGALGGLSLMAIISVALGQLVRLFPKIYTHYGSIALFFIFGVLMIIQAWKMTDETAEEEEEEARELVGEINGGKTSDFKENFLILSKAFSLTFLAEWGDRTQIATINLSAVYDPLFVVLGAISGFAVCVGIAVTTGRLIAQYVSPRILGFLGGMLFLIFGFVTWFQGID